MRDDIPGQRRGQRRQVKALPKSIHVQSPLSLSMHVSMSIPLYSYILVHVGAHELRSPEKGTQLALSLIDNMSCMSYIRICSGISFSPNSNADSIFRCPVVTSEYVLVVLALVVILRIWYVVCFRSTLPHNNTTASVLAVKYGVRWPVHQRCG